MAANKLFFYICANLVIMRKVQKNFHLKMRLVGLISIYM